jgi:hypothetical protein
MLKESGVNENHSIEEILNSRCSCDFGADPKNNHWGMFKKDKLPSSEDIQRILQCCEVPQFSDIELLQWWEGKYLFIGFKKPKDCFEVRLLHIESGMQQEAIYLACTATGVGTCIQNLGVNGTEYGDKIATVKHIILEKADTYGNQKFSTAAPGPEKPFKKGKNISEPKRNGNVECLPELEQLTLFQDAGTQADETDISQLLWAAKGRTPHYIKSHPWGLTISTMGGGQNYTTVYLIKENKLFRYINWTIFRYIDWTTRFFPWWIAGNPTHDIKFVGKINVSSELDNTNVGIILSRNENTNRALWEVGYMLENMLLQAKSLGISYKSKVFTKDEIKKLERNGISDPVAALLL